MKFLTMLFIVALTAALQAGTIWPEKKAPKESEKHRFYLSRIDTIKTDTTYRLHRCDNYGCAVFGCTDEHCFSGSCKKEGTYSLVLNVTQADTVMLPKLHFSLNGESVYWTPKQAEQVRQLCPQALWKPVFGFLVDTASVWIRVAGFDSIANRHGYK